MELCQLPASILSAPGPLVWRSTTRQEAPGTQPHTTHQGDLSTCCSHSLAKCIMTWLDQLQQGCTSNCPKNCQEHVGYDVDFDYILTMVLALNGEDEEGKSGSIPTARFPNEFHNKEVTFQVEAKRSHEAKQMTVQIEVQTTPNKGCHWEDKNNPEISSPKHFTAIGLIKQKRNPAGPCNHAVFIKSYNPKRWEVETINSWGEGEELGTLKDIEFYQVDLIRLTETPQKENPQTENPLQEHCDRPASSSSGDQKGMTVIVKMRQDMEQLRIENTQLKEEITKLRKENEHLKSSPNALII